ncbi:Gfo/Idh/MocA family protein [Acidicapsa dinghuensis]|uniref:Gfo/Idh/MocA family protein n=1 Tax=Acidicapsa dinghuensis TaxID=2218256 RepID=A0ABW1EL75_9BACT|nr:Gfo/Idh/MocA family oxidoreductase [Acidicapsa dinghuensis]
MNLSRREFSRLSALGVAAQLSGSFLPRLHAQASASSEGKIGYAAIGLGRISKLFMAGVQNSSNSKITALVSGHPAKAEMYAEQYGIPKSSIYNYENMDELKHNKEVQAVYIGLPNSMHAEYTIRSAKIGKNVLCEKPMAVSVSECEAMIAACKEANVKLMIAYRLHYEPSNLRAVQLIRDSSIGRIQSIQSTYGFNCKAGEWRLDKAMAGGGPLMDVGIYSLNATRYLTGEEPVEFSAYAYSDPDDPRFKTVEENLNWVMKFPSGVLASCNTTYGGMMDGYYHVVGSHGWVEMKPAFNYDGLHLTAGIFKPGEKPQILDEPSTDTGAIHFTREANHFSECILQNKESTSPGEEGLRDMTYIREIYRSAGITMNKGYTG